MSVEIVHGTNRKPASSKMLIKAFETQSSLDGTLFLGYPIIAKRHVLDATFVSQAHGIVLFDLIEGQSLGDYRERQDDAFNGIELKLKRDASILDRRRLLIPIQTVSYGPALNQSRHHGDSEYLVATSSESLITMIEKIKWGNASLDIYKRTLSTLESVSNIRSNPTPRKIASEDSRGGRLKRIEQAIATLDHDQNRAVIETSDGVQRIRGLAGSGKTIVLALKAAYLHSQHPDWRIAITFHTRSLKGQYRRLITRFMLEHCEEEPDWNNINIINSWGVEDYRDRDRTGIYSEFCRDNNIPYHDYRSAKAQFPSGDVFERVCMEALERTRNISIKNSYDAILLDEAQDLSPSFLQLCYAILGDKKRLVYAYDELQNLTEGSLPSPDDIFGPASKSTSRASQSLPKKSITKTDLVLSRCYRNPRQLLVAAHAIGFGIYRDMDQSTRTQLVQMFDHSSLWKEMGYQVESGALMEGQQVTLHRNTDASPMFLEEHSELEDLIQFYTFRDRFQQAEWLADQIITNLRKDELRCDDIIVINPNPLTTRDEVGLIQNKLHAKRIPTHIAGVSTSPDIFVKESKRSVTFTGVHRAKGNEAGMVYVINAHDGLDSRLNLATIRNRLFTAMTRSKAWVRVVGIGPLMEVLIEEYKRLKDCDFRLEFIYPTAEQRKRLRTVHRDMTREERAKVEEGQSDLSRLVSGLERGNVRKEDLDPKLIKELLRQLEGNV